MKHFKVILFFACFILVERFCHRQTEGFRLHKIAADLPFNPNLATPPPTEEIKALLSQPYRFLGSGGQSYAFISQDKKTVIKFFKHHHLRPLLFSIQKERREERLHEVFTSFKIAYDFLKEETGLLFLHLNQGNDFQMNLTLIDPIGICHEINLDKTTFALQRRAHLALSTLQKLVKRNKVEEAKAHLCSLLNMLVKRIRTKIVNCDSIIKRNTGFINGEAVEIDLGSFVIDRSLSHPLTRRRALFFDTLKLRRWLKKHAPILLPFFDLQLGKCFANLDEKSS